METDSGEEIGKPEAIESVKTEWTWDFDDLWHEMTSVKVGDREYVPGSEGRFRLKGRCTRCWGGLIGKGADGHIPTAIRCRVCGILLEGDDAREEYQRMSDQNASNTFNMALGFPPKYREDATFSQKIFLQLDRHSEEEFLERVKEEELKGTKERWLTRSGFPAGSAGFLLLQARALMCGVERLPREFSVAPFSGVDANDDGLATGYSPAIELSEDPKASKNELMKRLGSTMTSAMMSAFACELVMKAIRLTYMNEARKSHDLWKLYCDLPTGSKARIKVDWPEVSSVLKSARHTFDKWRYFEANVGGRGMSAMIDTERAFDLAKAARVLLDEAEMMGLGYSLKFEATRRIVETGDRKHLHVKHRLSTTGTEAPPR